MDREEKLARTFVELADTLVARFDVANLVETLATSCVDLTAADGAGVVLAGEDGALRVAAAAPARVHRIETRAVQAADGPSVDAFRTGETVTADLVDSDRWPAVRPEALEAGYLSVVALPMRRRDVSLGALTLFRADREAPPEGDLALSRALADVATIGLLQQRAVREARVLAGQLQAALRSRVVIEQAKGVLAHDVGGDVKTAFELMRGYARRHNRMLRDVAHDVVEGRLGPDDLG